MDRNKRRLESSQLRESSSPNSQNKPNAVCFKNIKLMDEYLIQYRWKKLKEDVYN